MPRRPKLLLAIAVIVVASAALFPAFAAGRPANQIPVTDLGGTNAELTAPSDADWSNVEHVEIPLSSAPSGVPDASDTSVRQLTVQAAHTDDRFYLRVHWTDGTADETIDGPREFADAVAVQLPVNASTHPAIAMGSERTPVDVWYWRADDGFEELVAGGPGTITNVDSSDVDVTVERETDGWSLVLARSLGDEPNRASITTDQDLDVAFAVWNGSNMERSGQKAVSEWYNVPLGPQPSGPPYQALLWAVAGLAIVVVVAVTVLAMQRR